MTASVISDRFTADSGEVGTNIGDANTETITVPDGEIWYIEGGVVGASGNGPPNSSQFRVGIHLNEIDGTTVGDSARVGGNLNPPNDPQDQLAVGAYAYPGETIAIALNEPSNTCEMMLQIRRIL